jgi:membrane protease YdiL (CAAX protease family)
MTVTTTSGRPRVGAILVAAVAGFLAGQIAAMVLNLIAVQITHFPGGLSQLGRVPSPPWWSNVLGLLGLWAGFAAAIFFAYTQGNLRPLAHQWRLRRGDVIYVAVGIGCQVLIDLAYRPLHLHDLNRPVTHLFNSAHGLTFVLLVVMTAVVAPVMEEWLFRGVVYRAISEGIATPGSRRAVVTGVLVSAGLFALAHAEPLQFVGLAFLGVVLAVLVYRTQRLMPSVITHVSFNTAAVIALVAQRTGH